MTDKRKEILSSISHTDVPLTASDIHRKYSEHMDLATVYRGLHYLEDRELIFSFHFICRQRGGERYYFRIKETHVHFFHCLGCHNFIPIKECALGDLEKELESRYKIKIEQHILHFTGYCTDCS